MNKLIQALNNAHSAFTSLNDTFSTDAIAKVAELFGLTKLREDKNVIIYSMQGSYLRGEHGRGFMQVTNAPVDLSSLVEMYAVIRVNGTSVEFLYLDYMGNGEYAWDWGQRPMLLDKERAEKLAHYDNNRHVLQVSLSEVQREV